MLIKLFPAKHNAIAYDAYLSAQLDSTKSRLGTTTEELLTGMRAIIEKYETDEFKD